MDVAGRPQSSTERSESTQPIDTVHSDVPQLQSGGDKRQVHGDPEKQPTTEPQVNIEYVSVEDDPRLWSPFRKYLTLSLISCASVTVGLFSGIQSPAVGEMEKDLPATSSQFSLTISLFMLVQGILPLAWSAVSEIKGRKTAYLGSFILSTAASIAIALSRNIKAIIGLRCIQAAGSSAILTIGAATLADIYEPHERGTKMGIYYVAPLLGPSLGPLIGGGLTSSFGWQSIFWFCAISTGVCLLLFLLLFKDTFRKERSLTYQEILRQRLKGRELKRDLEINGSVEGGKGVPEQEGNDKEIKITLRDLSPFKPIYLVLRRRNNVVMLTASGIMFAWQIMIPYTIARTLDSKYGYAPRRIGSVSLAFGIGCLCGSVAGGRWSDLILAKLKAKNGGVSLPEMRLKSTIISIFILPAFILAGGWVTQEHVHVAAVAVMLFGGGFFCVVIYTSVLAYIVDANAGRSSSAVATNSVFRGLGAFLSIELVVPMQDNVGDGWMYTIWAGIELLFGLLIILTAYRGTRWRERAEERERRGAL